MESFKEVPRRALAIYAHPDDPEVGAGGTLAKWALAGCEVHVLVCTKGDKGAFDGSLEPEELAAQRLQESLAASRLLGLAGRHQLGIPDGELEERDLIGEFVAWIRRLTPEVVLCPDPTAVFFGSSYLNHRDHRQVGWAALDAVSPAASLPLYFPDAGPPHQVKVVLMSGTLEADCWVDISEEANLKADAVCCHESQLHDSRDTEHARVLQRTREAGSLVGVPGAELFRRLVLGI
jgi:LmbE family N-acetylglucosaminyl deacetylase